MVIFALASVALVLDWFFGVGFIVVLVMGVEVVLGGEVFDGVDFGLLGLIGVLVLAVGAVGVVVWLWY